MNKMIKMSYADKDIRLTVDENEKLVKAEVRKKDDPNKWIEVKSSWVGKTPSWNKLDEFLSEIAGVKVQNRRLFDSFEAVKIELMDAPVEVKEAFNSVVGYFDDLKGLEELDYKFLRAANELKSLIDKAPNNVKKSYNDVIKYLDSLSTFIVFDIQERNGKIKLYHDRIYAKDEKEAESINDKEVNEFIKKSGKGYKHIASKAFKVTRKTEFKLPKGVIEILGPFATKYGVPEKDVMDYYYDKSPFRIFE